MYASNIYKKGLLFISMLLVTLNSFGQENNDSGFKFKSWSITPIEGYDFSGRNSETFSGILPLSISMDLTCAISKNLISFAFSYGEETGVFSGSAHYKQISFLYGREFKLNSWLLTETHLGGGMFFYGSSDMPENISEFAIPFVGKLRFQTGEKFSIGIRFAYIFNSFNNLYSVGLLLQWNY